jgi:hypothetical protein
MQLSEARLRELVNEEVRQRLTEYYIDQEIAALIAEGVEADWDAAKRKARKKMLTRGGAAALALGIGAGSLKHATDVHTDTLGSERDARISQNVDAANTDESQLGKFADQLNNTAAFMWGVGDQAAMPVPGTDGKITVLPPSYSLAVRALLDKKANIERAANGQPPIMRFGELNIQELPEIGGDYEYQGTYKENVEEFFSVYSGKDMVDAMAVLQAVPELNVVSGTGMEEKIIMVNPNKIKPSYILPELGMTAQDYYNSQYGSFLGDGEKAAMELSDEEMTVTPDDDDKEMLDQGLIDATNKRALKLQQRSMKENRVTWKNYKNRKKVLA